MRPQVLKPGLRDIGLLLLFPLPFLGLGTWMLVEGATYGWVFLSFGGLILAFLLWILLSSRPRLHLTESHLEELRIRGATARYAWSDIGAFAIDTDEGGSKVMFTVLRAGDVELSAATRPPPVKLESTYGLGGRGLLELLKTRRSMATRLRPAEEPCVVTEQPMSEFDRARLMAATGKLQRLGFGAFVLAGLFGLMAVNAVGKRNMEGDVIAGWVLTGLMVLAGVVLQVKAARDRSSSTLEVLVGRVTRRSRRESQHNVFYSIEVGGVAVGVDELQYVQIEPGSRVRVVRTKHSHKVLRVMLEPDD